MTNKFKMTTIALAMTFGAVSSGFAMETYSPRNDAAVKTTSTAPAIDVAAYSTKSADSGFLGFSAEVLAQLSNAERSAVEHALSSGDGANAEAKATSLIQRFIN